MKLDKRFGWVIFSLACILLAVRFAPQINQPYVQSAPERTPVEGPTTMPQIRQATPIPQAVLQPTAGNNPSAATQPTQQPLRFTFPTPGPVPIVAWRPALYPIPWAPGPHDHFFFARPIAADEINWPLADYRYGGIFFGPDIVHTGIDIDAPRDTPVLAAAAGRVVWSGVGLLYGAGYSQDPYGNAVVIRHDFGYDGKRLYTAYAHMSQINVTEGQWVEQGDTIGLVGSTGNTTGPHLHFEVRIGSNYFFATRNPELWLSPPQGWGVLVGRIMDKKGNLLSHKEIQVASVATDQMWDMRTYGYEVVNSDDYYKENLVLSDLPAGKYVVWTELDKVVYRYKFEIRPGDITYINFRGEDGFDAKPPPAPTPGIPTASNP